MNFRIDIEDGDLKLYQNKTFTFGSGVTCLIGPNGSGKSYALAKIKDYLNKVELPVFYYNNEERERNADSEDSFYGRTDKVIQRFIRSEGEKIRYNLEESMNKLRTFISKTNKEYEEKSVEEKQIFILLDGLDSGLSIDNILYIRDFIDDTLLPDLKSHGFIPYIILSANMFETITGYDCIDVRNSKFYKFYYYEDFKNLFEKV